MIPELFIPLTILILSAPLTIYFLLFYYARKKKKKRKAVIDPAFEPLRAQSYPPPFPNGWFNLCSSDEVKKGQVIEIEAFGRKIAVFRGHDGQIGAVDAFCPHLGANLADGCVKGNHLSCPFHGWEFNYSGKCVRIPYSENGHLNAKTTAKAWIVKENWGLVLAWYHADNQPPQWDTEGYLQHLKDYKYFGRTKELLHIHLQDFSENGADYAHFGVVHNLLTIPFVKRFFHIRHTTQIRFGEGKEKHMAWFTDRAEVVRNRNNKVIKGAGGEAVVTYFGPGFLVFDFNTRFGRPVILKTFTPIGELKVRMEDHIYAPKGSWRPAIQYLVNEASLQFHDDILIWERKTFRQKPVLVKGDGPIMKMRQWYSQFYSEKSYLHRKASALDEQQASAYKETRTDAIVEQVVQAPSG